MGSDAARSLAARIAALLRALIRAPRAASAVRSTESRRRADANSLAGASAQSSGRHDHGAARAATARRFRLRADARRPRLGRYVAGRVSMARLGAARGTLGALARLARSTGTRPARRRGCAA